MKRQPAERIAKGENTQMFGGRGSRDPRLSHVLACYPQHMNILPMLKPSAAQRLARGPSSVMALYARMTDIEQILGVLTKPCVKNWRLTNNIIIIKHGIIFSLKKFPEYNPLYFDRTKGVTLLHTS